MKRILLFALAASALFSCKKPSTPAPSTPTHSAHSAISGILDITIGANTYHDTCYKDSANYVSAAVNKTRTYYTQTPVLFMDLIASTKHMTISMCYGQKSDTSRKDGIYTTGLTYERYSTTKRVVMKDEAIARDYGGLDTTSPITITLYNDSEISGVFSINLTCVQDGRNTAAYGSFYSKH